MTTSAVQKRPKAATKEKILEVKMVIVGEMAVGKTNLVTKFARGEFDPNKLATIGAAFLTKSIILDDITLKFDIWDTAGQEKYHSLVPMYYRGVQAALAVYDITDSNSFERAKFWVDELRDKIETDVVIALAGNKADLDQERMVSYKEGAAFGEERDLLFMETSAKTGKNVKALFHAVGMKYKYARKIPKESDNPRAQSMRLSEYECEELEPKRSCCKSH